MGGFGRISQKEELEKLKGDSNYKRKVLDRLDKLIKKYGTLRVLKKGFSVEDGKFYSIFSSPLSNSSETIKRRFLQNELGIIDDYNSSNQRTRTFTNYFLTGLPNIGPFGTLNKIFLQFQTGQGHSWGLSPSFNKGENSYRG